MSLVLFNQWVSENIDDASDTETLVDIVWPSAETGGNIERNRWPSAECEPDAEPEPGSDADADAGSLQSTATAVATPVNASRASNFVLPANGRGAVSAVGSAVVVPPPWPPRPTAETEAWFSYIKTHLNHCIDSLSFEEYVKEHGLLTRGNIYGDEVWKAMTQSFGTYRWNYQYGGCEMFYGWFWLPSEFSKKAARELLAENEKSAWPYPCLYCKKSETEVWVLCLYVLRMGSRAWVSHRSRVQLVVPSRL